MEMNKFHSAGNKPRLLKTKLLLIVLLALSMTLSSCSLVAELLPDIKQTIESTRPTTSESETTAETTPAPTPTPKPVPIFVKQASSLEAQGFDLPRKKASAYLSQIELMDILAQVYEHIGGPIDTSLMNPEYGASEGIRKMTRIGLYYDDSYYGQNVEDKLSYSNASYWIFELRKKLLQNSVARTDMTAYPQDLLLTINMSSALYGWKPGAAEAVTFTMDDLLQAEMSDQASQPLTRQTASHMMVNAFEQVTGEKIETDQSYRYPDTPDIESLKATNFFFWPEEDAFMPDLQGTWDDDFFLGTYNYDSQLGDVFGGYERICPYGAIISSITALLDSAHQFSVIPADEYIVLNERPYPWHIYQIETGEYGDVNCMPSCIEMSMLYQGLENAPNAESLRALHPLDGMGWTDYLAETLMTDYGLEFYYSWAESYETSIDEMLSYLDQGNILYVMFRDEYTEGEGHAVILKGYRRSGETLEFIVSDPNFTQIGPFGYPEYYSDARKMVEDIIRHVPRYFIIPPGA